MTQQIQNLIREVYSPILRAWRIPIEFIRVGDTEGWVVGSGNFFVIRMKPSHIGIVIDSHCLPGEDYKHLIPTSKLLGKEGWSKVQLAIENCISAFVLTLLRNFLIGDGWDSRDIGYDIGRNPFLYIRSLDLVIIFDMETESPTWAFQVYKLQERRLIWEKVKKKKISPLIHFSDVKDVLNAVRFEEVL